MGRRQFKCTNLMSAMLTLCACALLAGAAQAQKWGTAAPFPAPSEELYGVAVGGRMYVFGGQELGWKSLGMVYEYDPAADRWTRKKDMPLPAKYM